MVVPGSVAETIMKLPVLMKNQKAKNRRPRITGKRRPNSDDEVRDRRDRGRSKRRRRDDECLDSSDGDAASERSGSGRSVESLKSASPTPSAPRAAGRSYSSYLEMREASPPAPHPVPRPTKPAKSRRTKDIVICPRLRSRSSGR